MMKFPILPYAEKLES